MAYRDKQAERVHTQKGLDRFKAEVNLFNLAQRRYGLGVDYRKSTKRNMHEANSISMSNGTDRGHNKADGDVINFIQWQENDCNLGQLVCTHTKINTFIFSRNRNHLRDIANTRIPFLTQHTH